jgi:hypothetical protein
MATRFLVCFFIFLFPIDALSQDLKDVKILTSNANTANIVILDKITSKKNTHTIQINKKYNFYSLEVLVKRCVLDNADGSLKTSAFVQIQNSNKKNKDQVYVYNGWMISGYPSINPMEHVNYDIWIESCL